MAKKKHRVLVDTTIDGVKYKANEVVDIDDKKAEPYLGESLDDAKEGVDYCCKEEGAEPRDHAAEVKALKEADKDETADKDEGTGDGDK